jgi:prepilin-type N-terminal cleavage/methylation domain-containing protein
MRDIQKHPIFNHSRSGFTIVELLIVIVVIGILAAITIVAYNGVQQRAAAAAASSAVSQANQKLELYKVDNATYPTTGNLSLAGIIDGDVTYQYTSNGTTFCLTGTKNTTSYKISDSGTPTAGGCAGHGQGGVAALTNYYRDPKPVATSPAGAWGGGNTMTISNMASPWSVSGRMNRMSFSNITSASQGGPTITIGSTYLAGQKFTITAGVRLVSGTANVGSISMDRNTSAGTLTTHATGGSGTLSTTSTRNVYATFTADSTAVSDGLRLYFQISNKLSDTVAEYADVNMYPGDYDASRNWASGDSLNWVWNGTPNNSTSTGPAQ